MTNIQQYLKLINQIAQLNTKDRYSIIYCSKKEYEQATGNKVKETAGGITYTHNNIINIYLFNDNEEKNKKSNRMTPDGQTNYNLTFIVYAAFHEIEHQIQFRHSELIEPYISNFNYFFKMELLIMNNLKYIDEQYRETFDYTKHHDRFLFEIDANKSGIENALTFKKNYNLTFLDSKYYNSIYQITLYHLNNYDIPLLIEAFISLTEHIENGYITKIVESNLLIFFDKFGRLKSLKEILHIKHPLVKYFVTSNKVLKNINQCALTENETQLLLSYIDQILGEHDTKARYLIRNAKQIDESFSNVKNFSVSKQPKQRDPIDNSKYYANLRKIEYKLLNPNWDYGKITNSHSTR